jgi:hypothetical protein
VRPRERLKRTLEVIVKNLASLFVLVTALLFAGDSLPWEGAIVFDDWVRVDDAPGLSGHPADHPQTIMDENWVLYTVWADDRDNNERYEVYFATSTDTGRSWSTPNLNLSQSPSPYYVFPWLTVDPNGLSVVWQEWRGNSWQVIITRSVDRGMTWTAPVRVPGITVDNDFRSGINFGPQPKLATDSRSNPDTTFLYLVWADNATGAIQIKLARSTDSAASFTDLGIVDRNLDNVNRNPFITVDDRGWVHCAWARGTGGSNQDPHPWIGYNRSQDRGGTFLAQDIIVNDDRTGVYRGNPSMTFDPASEDIMVSWEDSRRAGGNVNPDIWFSRIHRDSLGSAPNQRVNWWAPDTGLKYDNFKPVVRMDPEGVMVAAWHDDPERDGSYGIHLAAYTDTSHRFSNSRSLIQTFTGTSGANFGNGFYAPSLFVRALVDTVEADTITHFFVVWQDLSEDSLGGNIYSVHGRVVLIRGDLDVDNDSLDVENDTLNLGPRLPGETAPYLQALFLLANTDTSYNPDPEDGPSLSPVDSLRFSGTLSCSRGTLDSILIRMPGALEVGHTAVCTLSVHVPPGTPDGDYFGIITIEGEDERGVTVQETFGALAQVLGDLDVDNDSLGVKNDTLELRPNPPDTGYVPYARGVFLLANTSASYNPDPEDGPSRSRITSLRGRGSLSGPRGTLDSIILAMPGALEAGQTAACTLSVWVSAGTPDGDYSGVILVEGEDAMGVTIQETFNALVRILGDLDVDNDSLRVQADTIDLWTQPAGPVYSPYAKAEFMLANTSASYNPDPEDGPSRSRIDFLEYTATVTSPSSEFDSIYVLNLPSSLDRGQSVVCTLALVVPIGTPLGEFAGNVLIQGRDSFGFVIQERFGLRVNGPEPRLSLDSLRVAPIPYKPYRNPDHRGIHFQGLTRNARVFIYDASGHSVWSATEDGDGHVVWDAEVASGLYLYLVVSESGETKKGRLSVIR